jgi:hypothetical protein
MHHLNAQKIKINVLSTNDDHKEKKRKNICISCHFLDPLDKELFDLSLDVQNLRLQVRGFVGGDRSSNDRARNTTGTTQGSLGGNKDVGNVLVFTKERKVKKNFKRFGISCRINEYHINTQTTKNNLPAMMMNSEIPLFKVLVASLAPFFNCL